jgi:hypothetical protein
VQRIINDLRAVTTGDVIKPVITLLRVRNQIPFAREEDANDVWRARLQLRLLDHVAGIAAKRFL